MTIKLFLKSSLPILIILDVIGGCLLLFSAFFIKTTPLSSLFSVAYVISSVIPGIALSGYVRNITVGGAFKKNDLLKYSLLFFFVNLAAIFFYFLAFHKNDLLDEHLLLMTCFFSFSSICQAFNSIWFYLYQDKKVFLLTKTLTVFLRTMGAILAIVYRELLVIIFFGSLVQVIETIIGFIVTKNRKSKLAIVDAKYTHLFFGLSIGCSRAIIAAIKIFIEQSIGFILPTIIVFEQISGGFAGLYEKYLVGQIELWPKIKVTLYSWLTISAFLIIDYYFLDFFHLPYKFILFLIVFLNIIPIPFTYHAIKLAGLRVVAFIIFLSSFAGLLIVGLNYLYLAKSSFYLLAYSIIPIILTASYSHLLFYKNDKLKIENEE